VDNFRSKAVEANRDTAAINTNTDRRQGIDRRQWTCQHDFPYVDSHGYLVVQNRRKQKDRRHCSHTVRVHQ